MAIADNRERSTMQTELIENRVFERVSLTENPLLKGVYEECRFIKCYGNRGDLSGITFRNCLFENCDLSLATVRSSLLQDVQFRGCKLLGVQFTECKGFLLQLDFEECMLKLALFSQLKLKNTRFKNCDLQEADFTEADLTGAIFEACDLLRTTFLKSNLEHADLRSAFNYSIDPETNRLKKARFLLSQVIGLLDRYDIIIE